MRKRVQTRRVSGSYFQPSPKRLSSAPEQCIDGRLLA
jgi:hypothetical protein